MTRRTLLGVWAHPDDEAYLTAGLMMEHVERGDRVVVVTATLGEHGTADPRRWPPDRLAARRAVELRRSLAELGVDELHLLGFGDGRCSQHDGTHLLARHIHELRPDLVVTFGPDGMTGHPDHRAVSRWTTDAWHAAGAAGELWYATLTADFHRRWGQVNEHIGLWSDQPAPPCTSTADVCHEVALSGAHLDAKYRALLAHRSQTAPLARALGHGTFRRWWARESFRAARHLPTHINPHTSARSDMNTNQTITASPIARNGVPLEKLFGTIAAVRNDPDLARFRFTAVSSWIEGTATRSTFRDWYGIGATRPHAESWTEQSDHPTLGHGHGPTPQEHVLHALAACLTAGIATTATARKITLTKIESVVEGDIDVRGILGVDAEVRNGFAQIRATFTVEGDASRAELDALVEASTRRSATYEMLVNPTPVLVATA